MCEERRTCFCSGCHDNTTYVANEEERSKSIKGKTYRYKTVVAYCEKCGEEVSVPGMMDEEIKALDKAYRTAEGLVLKEDIGKLLKLYNIGKAPLSYALGFGEVTIGRYLDGQIPSKEYSDIIKKALSNPSYMSSLLDENKTKVGELAYTKAKNKIAKIQEDMSDISKDMIYVISYIFGKVKDITPLALQKLLYYAQGISLGLYGREMFSDNCEAWQHGPVYRQVYNLFRSFGYNSIDDERFVIFSNADDKLTDEKKKVLDVVLESFGLYSGKVLEDITHKEDPWKTVRLPYGDNEKSADIISKENIQKYFYILNEKYRLDDVECVKEYISDKLKQ